MKRNSARGIMKFPNHRKRKRKKKKKKKKKKNFFLFFFRVELVHEKIKILVLYTIIHQISFAKILTYCYYVNIF